MPKQVKWRYKKQGECNRCGWCCRYHGCEFVVMEEGKAVCLIYDDRPNRCKVFPEAPPILHEGCGFYFLDTCEKNKKVKYGKDL